MNWLGIDIGGANLKVADGQTYAATVAFDLWRRPEDLVQRLRQLLAESPGCDHVVATMTGELADCFANKAAGVSHIVAAMEQAAAGRHLRFYAIEGKFVTAQVALQNPHSVAAANWHALARFALRFLHPSTDGILLDIGSTTTDIVPLTPDPSRLCGTTDTERLASGSLLYTGVVRSPVCAVAPSVPYRGRWLPVAQEYFATMRDVYLLTGDLPPDGQDCATADGRPALKANARVRLGRMICADEMEFHHKDAAALAAAVREQQLGMIRAAISAMLSRMQAGRNLTVVISGKGEFLARRALSVRAALAPEQWPPSIPFPATVQLDHSNAQIVSLHPQLGSSISIAAPAHAIAVLAREHRTGETSPTAQLFARTELVERKRKGAENTEERTS